MVAHADTMRLLAERYLALAKGSVDAEERRKFLDYAAAYADLAKQIDQRPPDQETTPLTGHVGAVR
jgi:hypothetical protein